LTTTVAGKVVSHVEPGMGASARLQVEGITKRFGAQLAVDSLSFSVEPGEIVGFVGPNGAGKSTTLRIVSGLISPDGGRILLDGVDQRSDPIGFRARLGVMIESPAIYPMLTAFDHLAYIGRLRGTCETSHIENTLRGVGLAPESRKRVDKFSLGMKQRLGIAMALFTGPSLLVLDEPMNGLDPSGIAELRSFLRELPGRTGASILMSSHLLGEIEQTCHRVVFIRQGKLLAEADLAGDRPDGLVQLWLRTGDDGRAVAVLRESPLVAEVAREVVGLTCRVAAGHVAALAPLLVAERIDIFEMTSRSRRLEETYLARYGDDDTRLQ
jgi:ABC-type multidrug transport system ATPase subunit